MDVAKNFSEIRKEKGVKQEVVADALGVDVSAVSNIEKGKREIRANEIEIIANVFGVDPTYLLTYPDVYVKKTDENAPIDPIEATLQIKLRSDTKDQVLKLVFGEQTLEILNQK